MYRGLLVAVGLMLIFGATALARSGEQAARPRTLAEVRGSVLALAQDGHRIAWIRTSWGHPLQMLTLPGRRPVDVGFVPLGDEHCVCRQMAAIAVSADGRVVWQELTDLGNTYLSISLRSAALRAPRTRFPGGTTMGLEHGNPDWLDPTPRGVPAVADGKAILFYADCESSVCSRHLEPAVYRLVGRRSKRLASVNWPLALAVGGRRFAIVTNNPRCCNFTPVWSHDGTRLAWIYHGNLWTIRADGTGDRQVAAGVEPFGGESDDARRPSWSPDDARLVFERSEWDEGVLRSRGVYRVDVTGGGLRRLASGKAPAWSPDGTRIAFVRGTGVFAINPDGTGTTRLTATARATAGPLSWSPDSTRIAVSRGGDIYAVRADGAGEARLTTSRAPETQPAWSADGARIAYVAGSTISVVNADGTGATRLTSRGDTSPAWSPDSKRIVFVRGFQRVWVMNADGSGQRRLMPAKQSHLSPQWAPGGSTIAVGDLYDEPGGYPSNPGIRLVSPVDGKAKKLAPVLHSPVQIRDALTGRLIKRFRVDGDANAVALGPSYVALLVDHEPGVRVELYNLNGSFRKAAAVPANVRNVSAAGRTVVFATGRVIRRMDAITGAVTTLATARRKPVGLTIEGRRIVWAENVRGRGRIVGLTLPR
jgi:Tol biopolymer transport system component